MIQVQGGEGEGESQSGLEVVSVETKPDWGWIHIWDNKDQQQKKHPNLKKEESQHQQASTQTLQVLLLTHLVNQVGPVCSTI